MDLSFKLFDFNTEQIVDDNSDNNKRIINYLEFKCLS